MKRTLRLVFALKITYRVNSILYGLKQMPLVKRLLPQKLYQVRGLKIFAGVLAVLWEIITAFGGKCLYLAMIVLALPLLYAARPADQVFLHMLLLLSLAGCLTNTKLFAPSKDKYYAMILLRMDARDYTLATFAYAMVKMVVGFLPFMVLFGRGLGLPVWVCLALPFAISGMKFAMAGAELWRYARTGVLFQENNLRRREWITLAVLLGAALFLPALGIVLPSVLSLAFFLLGLLLGAVGLVKVWRFDDYTMLTKRLLYGLTNLMDASARAKIIKQATEEHISADVSITSKRSGFEYLNELFIKRHQRILWQATKKITFVCCFLVAVALLAVLMVPEAGEAFKALVLSWLPYFVFIMYAINRGANFTQALFMNCDHSLLTYAFYKKPENILRLFRIRLREIVKIGAVPALVLGGGLALVLFVSGGTDNPLIYLVLVVSIFCMSVFFSIHYLTIYYLLQPYNAATEIKSGTYRLVTSLTYVVCVVFVQVRLPLLLFGTLTILFCVCYSIISCMLVYRFAPRTFRIRA